MALCVTEGGLLMVVQVVLVLFFVEPLAALLYLLMDINSLMDPDYKGYVVVAFVVLGIVRRFINKGGV